MPVLTLACHLPHNTPHIPSRYNNEQTTKQTKAINNSYIYINISCRCDTNRAGHFTLDAYASRPVACLLIHDNLVGWYRHNRNDESDAADRHRRSEMSWCHDFSDFQFEITSGLDIFVTAGSIVEQKSELEFPKDTSDHAWWCHDHGNFFRIVGPLWVESPVTDDSSHKGPVKRFFYVSLMLKPCTQLCGKQWQWWFETPWHSCDLLLINCGLATPYGGIDLSQYWLR